MGLFGLSSMADRYMQVIDLEVRLLAIAVSMGAKSPEQAGEWSDKMSNAIMKSMKSK